MSTQRLGVERCAMVSPHGAGAYVRGTAYINAKLAQGWTIVPNDFRNHLTRDIPIAVDLANGRDWSPGQDPKEEAVSIPCDNDTAKAEPAKVEVSSPTSKRPRIKRP